MFSSEKAEWGGFWCILAGPGGVDESGNLSPKQNHPHVLTEQQEWLFARAMFGMLCTLSSPVRGVSRYLHK